MASNRGHSKAYLQKQGSKLLKSSSCSIDHHKPAYIGDHGGEVHCICREIHRQALLFCVVYRDRNLAVVHSKLRSRVVGALEAQADRLAAGLLAEGRMDCFLRRASEKSRWVVSSRWI